MLQGKVCLVTGGARGIGRAVVERYLEEGASAIVVVDRLTDELEALRRDCGSQVSTLVGDVRDYATHRAAVELTCSKFGGLDVLVGNAGIFDFRKRLEDYDPEVLAATMDELHAVNLRGYLYAAHAARAALVKAEGCMIFTASIAGLHAGGGGVVYTTAKHAVIGLVRQLAHELAPEIRVNAVAPGGTDTALSGAESLQHQDRALNAREGFKERIERGVPLAFAQQPEDHAGAYAFLASKRNARAITGTVIMSDGGVEVRSL